MSVHSALRLWVIVGRKRLPTIRGKSPTARFGLESESVLPSFANSDHNIITVDILNSLVWLLILNSVSG
jgi:hypothetical protein